MPSLNEYWMERKMKWRFDLVCPVCGKLSETMQENYVPSPDVNCGDCLMDRVAVVKMKVVNSDQNIPDGGC